MVSSSFLARTTIRYNILSLSILFTLIPINALAEEGFSFEPKLSLIQEEPDTVRKCKDLKKKLQQKQDSIKTNEKSLSLKITNKELEKEKLNELIRHHLASITNYNHQIELFNDICASEPDKKQKPAQQKTSNAKPADLSSERWEEVLLSKEKIRSMTGYFLQIGAFKKQYFAKKIIRKFSPQWTMHQMTHPYVYAVWAGPFDDLSTANEAKSLLKNKHQIDSYIIEIQ